MTGHPTQCGDLVLLPDLICITIRRSPAALHEQVALALSIVKTNIS
jgi:hypothetical protein